MHTVVTRPAPLGRWSRSPARGSRPSPRAARPSKARALPILLLALVGCTNAPSARGGEQKTQGAAASTAVAKETGGTGTPICNQAAGCQAEASRVCNANGWCWENPLPFGMNLTDVWGSSGSNLWAVGMGGTLLRYDGTAWQAVNAGTEKDLSGVWGTAANNVWAVGDNYVRVFDGTSWRAPLGAPTDLLWADVGGSSAADVWVIGAFGQYDFNRYNGLLWTGHANPMFFSPDSIYAVSPSKAWAVGFSDTALAWDGVSWKQITLPMQTNYDVWGSSASDVWIAGREGVSHWNGSTWSAAYDTGWEEAYAVHGTGPSDVWVGTEKAMLHYDGTAWTRHESGSATKGIMALASNNLFAVGSSGSILHWNGSTWARQSGFGSAARLGAMWATSDEIWFLGRSALRYRSGTVEDFGELASIEWYDRTEAWGSGPNDIWYTAPSSSMFHWDGTTWSSVSLPLPNPYIALRSVWGSDQNNVYVVTEAIDPFDPSEAYVVRWDGVRWSVVHIIVEDDFGAGVDLNAVAGTSANDVWVAAENGALWHFDGNAWTRTGVIDNSVYDLWASPSGTLWATTGSGVYRKPLGGAWARVSSSPSTAVGYISGTSDTNVWVTEGNLLNPTPIVYRYDGISWKRQNTGAGQGITAIGTFAGQVWIAGDSGGVLRKALP